MVNNKMNVRLRDFLNTPFPRLKKSRKHFLWVLLIGLLGSIFIIIFRPFGIENVYDQWYFNIAVFSLGMVFTTSYLIADWWLPRFFTRWFERWTLGKTILWYTFVLMFVGGALFWYKSYLAGFTDFTIQEYFFVTGRTFFITFIVLSSTLGFYQYFIRKRTTLFTIKEEKVVIGNNEQSVQVHPNDILYLNSDDNYVDIHYLENGIRQKQTIRSTLKDIETQLANLATPVYRCHRSYLVNINRVTIEKSSSRSMTLVLENNEDKIPVSQRYIPEIKQYLSIHH